MESPLRRDLRLIETFAWTGREFPRLDRHLARARAAAQKLGFAWDAAAADRALASITGPAALRIRLTFGPLGDAAIEALPLSPAAPFWHVTIGHERIRSDDPFRAIKSTERGIYDRARAALPQGADEVIFLNEKNELAEGTITNIFFDAGRGLCTPPLASGALPGILRAELLASGMALETTLHGNDLATVELWVGNALRGLIPARLIAAPPASPG